MEETLKGTWRSSFWGRFWTRSGRWRVEVDYPFIRIDAASWSLSDTAERVELPVLKKGWFWSSMTWPAMPGQQQPIRLGGIPNRNAQALFNRLQRTWRLRVVSLQIETVHAWSLTLFEQAQHHRAQHWWITEETLQQLLKAKPQAEELLQFHQDSGFCCVNFR